MAYALENALYQWRDGERRLAGTPEPARADLDRAADAVVEELRKRLGSSFLLEELADLYDQGTDWATELAGAPRRRHRRRGRGGRGLRALRPRGVELRGRARRARATGGPRP